MSYLQDQEELIERWKREQLTLKEKLVTIDKVKWKLKLDDDDNDDNDERLTLIGGVDISFPKGDDVHACACLVIISYPGLEVVYEDLAMVHLTSPYVPEFLAFREVEFLVESIKRLQQRKPDMMPQVIMVDGNGILHPRGFGIASHLGVITDIPTIGVAKNLFHVDGIEKGEEHTKQISCLLQDKGNSFPLVGKSGTTWGMALRSSKKSTTTPVCKPIYVSVGHKVSLDTAVKLVDACCRYRIPEPTRQADMRSREFLRQHYEKELKKCGCQNEECTCTSDDKTPESAESTTDDKTRLEPVTERIKEIQLNI